MSSIVNPTPASPSPPDRVSIPLVQHRTTDGSAFTLLSVAVPANSALKIVIDLTAKQSGGTKAMSWLLVMSYVSDGSSLTRMMTTMANPFYVANNGAPFWSYSWNDATGLTASLVIQGWSGETVDWSATGHYNYAP